MKWNDLNKIVPAEHGRPLFEGTVQLLGALLTRLFALQVYESTRGPSIIVRCSILPRISCPFLGGHWRVVSLLSHLLCGIGCCSERKVNWEITGAGECHGEASEIMVMRVNRIYRSLGASVSARFNFLTKNSTFVFVITKTITFRFSLRKLACVTCLPRKVARSDCSSEKQHTWMVDYEK